MAKLETGDFHNVFHQGGGVNPATLEVYVELCLVADEHDLGYR